MLNLSTYDLLMQEIHLQYFHAWVIEEVPEHDLISVAAVNKINLSVEAGEVFGLLGPNGAGKTTTLEMLEGLNKIDGGSILVDQIDVNINPYAVKKIIGVQLQSNEYFDRLNLLDLLILFANLYSVSIDPKALLAKVDLENKISALPDELSGGQKQRFSIACALVQINI